MALTLRRVRVAYGPVVPLAELDASLLPGQVTVLIGPNAAGKSTLLRCAAGLLPPVRGEVLLDGRPVHGAASRWLARSLAFVPQRPSLAADFRVREVLALGRYAAADDAAEAVGRVSEELALGALQERRFRELSAGQQQLVVLGRALVQLQGRGYLLLDEPTSAMDLRHVQRVSRVLRKQARAGMAVLVALHDLSTAARMGDTAWLLDRGRLLAAGPVGQVLQPGRLEPVFGVAMEWVADRAGERHLVLRSGS